MSTAVTECTGDPLVCRLAATLLKDLHDQEMKLNMLNVPLLGGRLGQEIARAAASLNAEVGRGFSCSPTDVDGARLVSQLYSDELNAIKGKSRILVTTPYSAPITLAHRELEAALQRAVPGADVPPLGDLENG